MNDDRTQGVTEARFALTLVICALVAVGFVLVFRLTGGPSNSTLETRPHDIVVQPATPPEDDTSPRVLPVEGSGTSGSRPPEVATRTHLAPNDGPTPPVLNPNTDAQRR